MFSVSSIGSRVMFVDTSGGISVCSCSVCRKEPGQVVFVNAFSRIGDDSVTASSLFRYLECYHDSEHPAIVTVEEFRRYFPGESESWTSVTSWNLRVMSISSDIFGGVSVLVRARISIDCFCCADMVAASFGGRMSALLDCGSQETIYEYLQCHHCG